MQYKVTAANNCTPNVRQLRMTLFTGKYVVTHKLSKLLFRCVWKPLYQRLLVRATISTDSNLFKAVITTYMATYCQQ